MSEPMSTYERPIVSWRVETPFLPEQPLSATREDAILRHLGDRPESPDVVVLVGYARMRVQADTVMSKLVVEYVLESWEEEYGDPDGDHEAPITDAMRDAARQFIGVMEREYQPWVCEPWVVEEVDLGKWRQS